MADRSDLVGVTPVNNPLLSAAGISFPFENFTSTAQLVPISQRGSSLQLSEDVGEVDSFLGQDALPSLPLPGVLPPVLKTPSAEQLQPITFFNALGQPTGGGGLDFLAPAGANSKNSDSFSQPRHKVNITKRRPVIPTSFSSNLVLSPSKSITASSNSAIPPLPPTTQVTSQSYIADSPSSHLPPSSQPPPQKSSIFQELSKITQLSLFLPKSQSAPSSPKNQFQSSLSESLPSSKSQPPTVQPSPVHESQQSTSPPINQNRSPPISENLSLGIKSSPTPSHETLSSNKIQLDTSLVHEPVSLSTETLNLNSKNNITLSQSAEITAPVTKSSLALGSAHVLDLHAQRQVNSPSFDVTHESESSNPIAFTQVPDLVTDVQVISSKCTELVKSTAETLLLSTSTQSFHPSTKCENTSSPTDKLVTSDETVNPTVTVQSVLGSVDSLISTTAECSLKATETKSDLHHTTEPSIYINKSSEEQIISSASSVKEISSLPPPDITNNKALQSKNITTPAQQSSATYTADQTPQSSETDIATPINQNLICPSESQVTFAEGELKALSIEYQSAENHTLHSETRAQFSKRQKPETEPITPTFHYALPHTTYTSQPSAAKLLSSQSTFLPTTVQSFTSQATSQPTRQLIHPTTDPSQFSSQKEYQALGTQHIPYSSASQLSSPSFISDFTPSQQQSHLIGFPPPHPTETQSSTSFSQHQLEPLAVQFISSGTHPPVTPISSPITQVTGPQLYSSETQSASTPLTVQPPLLTQVNSSLTHETPRTHFFVPNTEASYTHKTQFYSPSTPLSQPPFSQFHSCEAQLSPTTHFVSPQTALPPFPPSTQSHSTPPQHPPSTLYYPLSGPPVKSSITGQTPTTQPLPLLTSQSAPHPPSNRYSIQARPHLLRKPYKVYAHPPRLPFTPPASQPPFPQIQSIQPASQSNLENQVLTYLVPTETVLDSLTSVPLTSEIAFNGHKNPVPGESCVHSQFHPTPPLPSSSPLASTPPLLPPSIGHDHLNPFSARATAISPNYSYQNLPVNNFHPHPTHSGKQSSDFAPSFEKTELSPLSHPSPASSSPHIESLSSTAPLSSGVSQSTPSGDFQEYSCQPSNNAIPLNSLPNTFAHPPSGFPLGTSKGYRLGKQRPRYAQVPDLAVSPSAQTPLLSGLSPNTLPVVSSASSETFSIYPPSYSLTGALVSPSEEYSVPSGNSSLHSEDFPSPFVNLASQPLTNVASAPSAASYRPVYTHWFFKKEVETKVIWKPFSVIDSLALENAFNSSETTADTVVATDGGRYDVKVLQRQRVASYWEEKKPTEVRRCSWFYKGSLDSRYTPYEEAFAARLEEEYKIALESNKWNRKIDLDGENVVLHGPAVMVHYSQAASTDQIGVSPLQDSSPVKPRVVKRGLDECELEEGEPSKVDHLLFLVHGIGSVCDLKFRDVVETVDDFRSLALQLTRSHFSACVESGQASRVEVLPVSWHGKLHGEDTGIDRKLQSITLKSIPRLRHFTNDTLLDILFYTSPVYCQTIMDTVGNEMNRMYELFLKRNPDFSGNVSLGGHSLGSLILFDLLYHQKVPKHVGSSPAIVMTVPGSRPPVITPSEGPKSNLMQAQDDSEGDKEDGADGDDDDTVDDAAMAMSFSRSSGRNRRASRINYMVGPAGTGQPYISYPQLNFKPENFFALGSPIGMFVTVRGIETLGSSFRLPTCPGFFNIFHPFDPVAYRIESLIDPDLAPTLNPVLIPHHKGRKRMHLELKETMARVGSDIKNKLVDSVKSTWNTMTQYTMFSKPEPSPPSTSLEQEVTKVFEAHLGPSEFNIAAENEQESGEQQDADVTLGCLNGGRRVDYVLQEAPLESFNEYLFALQSHVCYWESEDTMLMILTEVYSASGVCPDSALCGADTSRERSPIRMLSDQLLQSASPPKPQLFSALRFPSSTSLSPDGSQGVPRSQSVPKLSNEPNVTSLSTSSPGSLHSMGFSNHPPQMGVDPTAPMAENMNLAPPPTVGFVKQALQRK